MNNKTQNLSKREIAELSGVKIGRVKYYMGIFAEYFPEHKIEGKAHPTYERNAVQIVKLISDSIANREDHTTIRRKLEEAGYSPVETYIPETAKIDDKLKSETSTIVERLPDATNSLIALSEGLKALNRMNAELGELIKKQEQDITERDEIIEQLQQEKQELEAEIQEKTRLIEVMEAQLEEEKRKWGFLGLWKKKNGEQSSGGQ